MYEFCTLCSVETFPEFEQYVSLLQSHFWFTIKAYVVAVSQQLCSSVADQLTRTADSVVQLYKRLALEGDQTDHREMLRGLEEAVNEAQRTLRNVAAGGTGATAAESLSVASKLQDIVASGGQGDQANVVAMMQQYSDMLLTIVQQRIGNSTASSLQKPS